MRRLSFAKVRKLCFLCSCKQTLVFARRTPACAAPTSSTRKAVSHERTYKLAKVIQNSLYRFKSGYFSYNKSASIRYRGPLFTPQCHVMRVLIWMRTLYLTTFRLLNKNARPYHYKAWTSQDIFYLTLIGFVWKKKVITPIRCLEGE